MECVTRLELTDAVEVGRDHVGDVRVSAHGAAGDAQDDELSARDLNSPRGDWREEPSGGEATVKGSPSSRRPTRLECELTRNSRPTQKSGSKPEPAPSSGPGMTRNGSAEGDFQAV